MTSRSALRRAMISAASAALLIGALLAPASAQAKPSDAGSVPALSADAATTLATQVDSAGTYLDAGTGRMTVTVTDAAAAQRVRATGGVAKLVAHSATTLNTVTAVLDRSARITGTGWAIDPVSNQVVVSVDPTVSAASLTQLKAVTSRFGDAVRFETLSGALSLTINGGMAIYGGSSRCSLGFNVRSGSTYYFLTAGHCTNIASSWYTNSSHSTYIGPRVGTSFPGNDYGIVRYDSTVSHPGTVNLYNGSSQDITSAGNAFVGQAVKRSGSTTGLRSGTVLATNATVNYPQGTVTGLIRTNVCAEPGDSGGSLFAGTVALGLTSGGSGNCSSGGITYFQPVTEPLSVYGVSVY